MSLFGIGNFDVVGNGSGIQYKGTVATKAELEAITKKQNGDVYLVTSENKKYIWSAKDNAWQIYGDGGIGEPEVKRIIESYAYAKQSDVTTALAGKVNTEAGKGLSSNDFTTEEKNKLAKAITEHQSLDGYATETWVEDKGYLTQTDISGKADISYVDAGLAKKVNESAIKAVAKTGSYNDLTNKPTIPSKTSDLTNDSDYINSQALNPYRTSTAQDAIDVTKADKSYVDTELIKKASADDVSVLTERTTDLETFRTTASDDISNLQEYKADKTALDNKVDKVEGKGLSSNDFTNELKSNYDIAYTHSTSTHAPTDAEKNVIITVKQNGTPLTPDVNRAVNVITGGPTPTIVDPVATIVSCPEALNGGDTLEVKAKGTKGTYDLTKLSLWFNDVEVSHIDNPTNETEYDLTYDIPTTLENGTYEVKVVVNAGENTSGETTKDIVIGIDVVITECPEAGSKGQEIIIKAIPYKGVEPIRSLVLKVNGSVFDSVEEPESGTEYSLKYTPIDSGVNNIKVIANDFYMNEKVESRDISIFSVRITDCPSTGTVGQEITIKAIPYEGMTDLAKLELVINENYPAADVINNPVSGTEYSLKYTPTSIHLSGNKDAIQVYARDINGSFVVDFKEIEISEAPGYHWEVGLIDYDLATPAYRKLNEGTAETVDITYKYTDDVYGKPVFKYDKKAPDLQHIIDVESKYDIIASFTKTEDDNYKIYTFNENEFALQDYSYRFY